ncbi:MAG: SMI1/KNR4 family protein [Sandaracinus sp.]|nr:SMI1/KNR4 family protein [Sandaracinus sp.]MCB9621021.1 SMI1/KNR4 family protein [Sandaracinus sp.]MCB9635923.1 SMI1/KNR4 family protein [Sandaracinus sp.]
MPSTVDVDALLREPLPGVLPPSYVAFLTTYACLDIDFGDYTLPAMPPEAPLAHLRQLWADTSMHTAGYLAIGSARRCGDPICLDLRRRDERGETPVVLFNHDFVPRAAWARRGVLLPFAAELAPTFEALLRGLTEDDPHLFPPPLSLAEKRRMT